MWWRLRGRAWNHGKGARNRAALRGLVTRARVPPGLLAYASREPVGWVALAPREEYERLAHSRILAPVDPSPVWSITCFFVRPDWRGRHVAAALLQGAVKFAREQGATVLEAYPVDVRAGTAPCVWLYTGTRTMFAAQGFVEVARRSPTRPIMRRAI